VLKSGKPSPRLELLADGVRMVLTEAIEAGGSTLRDFRAADGSSGYFQHRFAVYDREGEPCPTPGCSGIVRRFTQGGRSTYHCPACQR
jgi:formamidopyrimidine-DNA glycosylase